MDFFRHTSNYHLKQQLDGIEDQLVLIQGMLKSLGRKVDKMAAQEQEFNTQLTALLNDIDEAITAIQNKAPEVDLTDEIAQIQGARDKLEAVLPAPTPPPDQPPAEA